MAFYERDYIEIKRDARGMDIVGTRREGIGREEVVEYLTRDRKKTRWSVVAYALMSLAMLAGIVAGLFDRSRIGILLLVLFGWVVIVLGIAARDAYRKLRAIDPEDGDCQRRRAPEALDEKLKGMRVFNDDHDLVSVESAAKGEPAFIGSKPEGQLDVRGKVRRHGEVEQLTRYAAQQVQASAVESAARPAAAPKVVDLRSDAERAVERSASGALSPEREQLAQDMAAYLKTHDTGNNMAHYREFRDLFHERSEAIAEGGGYHQALQEIYYRIRQLCGEQGVYFHSGGVDHVFEGEYWQS